MNENVGRNVGIKELLVAVEVLNCSYHLPFLLRILSICFIICVY